MSDDLPSIRLSGPNVTKEAAERVGKEFAALFNTVAEAYGCPPDVVRAGPVLVACDGCDTRRRWDDPADGWERTVDGHDFCPRCRASLPPPLSGTM